MTLLAEILQWTKTELKPWQSDAVRRLFLQGDLSPQDFDDLYAMLKSSHDIPDEMGRTPAPLSKEHIPEISPNAVPVALLAMKNLENVNRITRNQSLSFEPAGLTVVYGDNGSGKSGYARVLKHACRARTKREPVLPNANLPRHEQGTPSANFEVRLAGNTTAVQWKYGESPPAELSTVAVFDSHCARAYVDSEGDLIFMPWGLDVVDNLAKVVFQELETRLGVEVRAIDTSTMPFSDLAGSTKVGQLIAVLGPRTRPEDIEQLGTLSDEESARLTYLETILREPDAKAKADALRRDARRMDDIRSNIDAATKHVDDVAVQRIKTLDVQAVAAEQAEKLAAEELRAGEALLPGTGDAVWKQLFEAARRFSEQHAYRDRPFPVVTEGATCPLCQQALDPGAAGRLHRFEDYLKQDTARVAAEKRQARRAAEIGLAEASLGFSIEHATFEWLVEKDPDLVAQITALGRCLIARREWAIEALRTHEWESPPAISDNSRARLESMAEEMRKDAKALEATLDIEQKNRMVVEKAELSARKALQPRRDALLSLVGRMKMKHRLETCGNELRTKAVSDKVRSLASSTVTLALDVALNQEFGNLAVAHIKTQLRGRVEQGGLKIKLEIPGTVGPERILSEGEQRAIAIASFLAELGQSQHKGPAVFDDPVSSLDHRRRQRVAARLVSEAKVRQIIVFTHDTIFLAELHAALENQSAPPHAFLHLDATQIEAGYVNDGLPWHHQKHADRIDKLEKAQRDLAKKQAKLKTSELDSEVRHRYGQLRQIIERVVQDVLFCGVIERYNDYIRVPKLRNVVGLTSNECERIIELYAKASDIELGHDKASARQYAAPDPHQLGQDIQELHAIIALAKNRTPGA